MAVKIRIGDPKIKEEIKAKDPRTSIHDTADVRDIIGALVGRGYTTLADDDIKGEYARLQSLVGIPKAQKLMQQMFIYNQKPENKRLPVEARINQFYQTGSNDPETSALIGKAKNFGYGILPGFRTSPLALNQSLQGQFPTAMVQPNEELKQKILLKAAK